MSNLEIVGLDPRFRLRAPLRCDGVGKLDWGEDTSTGERVAVRWLPLKANGEAAVRACAQLPQHPAVPRILQIGRLEELAFLAMEFPDGELVSSRLADGEWLAEDSALLLGVQLAQALALVHQHGVVHGELSADSVLLARGDRILWWDVPLALADRMSDRRGETRAVHQLVKTAAYLAPECARGEPATTASDVYALGAVLCLASGAPPPGAGSTLGILYEVASGTWAPRVTPVFPERWAAVVRQMLEADPAKRPSAKEVATLFTSFASVVSLVPMPGVPAVAAAAPANANPEGPEKEAAGVQVAGPGVSSMPTAANEDEVSSSSPAGAKVSSPLELAAAANGDREERATPIDSPKESGAQASGEASTEDGAGSASGPPVAEEAAASAGSEVASLRATGSAENASSSATTAAHADAAVESRAAGAIGSAGETIDLALPSIAASSEAVEGKSEGAALDSEVPAGETSPSSPGAADLASPETARLAASVQDTPGDAEPTAGEAHPPPHLIHGPQPEDSSEGLRFAVIGAAIGVVAALALVLAFVVRAPAPPPPTAAPAPVPVAEQSPEAALPPQAPAKPLAAPVGSSPGGKRPSKEVRQPSAPVTPAPARRASPAG